MFERAVTSLAQLEEKLRRNLGLAGKIGAIFKPEMIPVIVVGDLREPGNASNQGRWFSWALTAATINTGGYMSIRPEQDVLIDQVSYSNSVAGSFVCYLTSPGVTAARPVAGLVGTWTDRKEIAADQVPLTGSGATFEALQGGGTNFAITNQVVAANAQNNFPVIFDVRMMLKAGSHLNFFVQGAGSIDLGVRGRIWP